MRTITSTAQTLAEFGDAVTWKIVALLGLLVAELYLLAWGCGWVA